MNLSLWSGSRDISRHESVGTGFGAGSSRRGKNRGSTGAQSAGKEHLQQDEKRRSQNSSVGSVISTYYTYPRESGEADDTGNTERNSPTTPLKRSTEQVK